MLNRQMCEHAHIYSNTHTHIFIPISQLSTLLIGLAAQKLSNVKKVKVLAAQLCLTLCDPIDCSLPGFCLWDSPGKNTGVGCILFSTGSSNPGIKPVSPALPLIACCERCQIHDFRRFGFETRDEA